MGFFEQTYTTGSASVTVKKTSLKSEIGVQFQKIQRWALGNFSSSSVCVWTLEPNKFFFSNLKVIYDYFNYLPDSTMTICYLKFTRVSDGLIFQDVRIQILDFRSQISDIRIQTSDFRLQISDFKY